MISAGIDRSQPRPTAGNFLAANRKIKDDSKKATRTLGLERFFRLCAAERPPNRPANDHDAMSGFFENTAKGKMAVPLRQICH
jgi:hypothetical protein